MCCIRMPGNSMVMDRLQRPGGRGQLLLQPQGPNPANSLISDFWSPGLCENTFPLFNLPRRWCFVRTVLANEPSVYLQYTQAARNPHFYPECLLNPIPLSIFTSPPHPPHLPRFLIALGETVRKAKKGKKTLKAQRYPRF